MAFACHGYTSYNAIMNFILFSAKNEPFKIRAF